MKLFGTVALAIAALISLGAARAAPTLHLPEDITAEATGPDGATVSYTAWAENPRGKEVPISCKPGGRSETRLTVSQLFPLGQTTVTCTAGDGDGGTTGSFLVTVRDTTAPTLLLPAPLDLGPAPTDEGVPSSDSRVQTFLASARATDVVDPAPVIEVEAPPVFAPGITEVRFTATDRFGNVAMGTSTVTVSAPAPLSPPSTPPPPPPPSPPSPPPPAPPPPFPPSPPPPAPPPPAPPPSARVDTAAPAEVTNLVARARVGAVALSWTLPADEDFAQVSVSRRHGTNRALSVYTGPGARFTDRNVRGGRRYTYVVSTHDQAGNRSRGVAAIVVVPVASRLVAPADGARVAIPPVLRWRPAQRAAYYNVQLWRSGKKILSVWPARSRLALRATWRYGGRSYRLSPGTYHWYVWPGYGAKSAARYGRLLLRAKFVVVRQS